MTLKAFWYMRPEWTLARGNIGDIITPYLVEKIAGRFPERKVEGGGRYLVAGSLFEMLQDGDSVWGAGMIQDAIIPLRENIAFYGVRGPLTRQKLLESGYSEEILPANYGDPGLLASLFFKTKREVRHRIGVIPHYIDRNKYQTVFSGADVHFIDIIDGLEHFIQEINSCEVVLSSSLHGIIISESYGIPTIPIKLSDNIIGGDFKFDDYYLSTNRTSKRIDLRRHVTDATLHAVIKEYPFSGPDLDKAKLLHTCPFYRLPEPPH